MYRSLLSVNPEAAWSCTALREDRFETWFQPIVDTKGDAPDGEGGEPRILAHDCLLRPIGGRGCGGSMHGDAEILEAARCLAIWSVASQVASSQRYGGSWFISLAPSSIHTPELSMKTTLFALEESGMRPQDIVFEAVECDLVRDPDHSRRIRDFLLQRGFGFALDNAGKCANTMRTIHDLRPDYIKLDRSLVRAIEDPVKAATVRKVVEVADRAGARVIAKGVDRTRTMEDLWLLGIWYMQGYLFGSPAIRV